MADILEYKPDWVETKEHYRAWWKHEYFGRCAIAAYAPRKNPPRVQEPPKPQSIHQQWYDLDLINLRRQYDMARTFYGGEAIPVWHGGYPGHTAIPVFLDAPLTLDWHTGWHDPILNDDEPDVRRLRIDTQHPNYLFAIETLQRAAAWSRGKCIVTIGAFGGCGDTLAALRTTNRLLYDSIDRPEWVRDAELYLMDMWCEHYENLYRHIRDADEGSTCWFELWSPGRFYASQNDFSYMIGPEMFRELFLPALRRQLDYLDHSVYHVDGIGAFVHVDALCQLPRLQAIQILPGEGKPSPLHYMDVLRKVQGYGKNLHISIRAEEVKTALDNLSARGLFISTWCSSEDEARAMLANVEKWSRDRG